MAEHFESRWAKDRSEMGDRKFSLWNIDGFDGVFIPCLVIGTVAGFLVWGLFLAINDANVREREAHIQRFTAAYEHAFTFNESWRTLRGERCLMTGSQCARLETARAYAMTADFDPHADTKEAAHFRDIIRSVPPLSQNGAQLSLERYVEVILKNEDIAYVAYPEDPRNAGPVNQYVFLPGWYAIIAYVVMCFCLSFPIYHDRTYWSRGRRFSGFYHPKNHTAGSWFFAFFHAPTLVVWAYALCDDGYAWIQWRFAHVFERRRKAREAARKAREEQVAREQAAREEQMAREQAIAGLDGDLRANYHAIMEAQKAVRELIDQAPDEDPEVKQSLLSDLSHLEQDVLRVHEMQTERDRAKRRQLLAEIAWRVQGIVADVRGRMDVSERITEKTRDTLV